MFELLLGILITFSFCLLLSKRTCSLVTSVEMACVTLSNSVWGCVSSFCFLSLYILYNTNYHYFVKLCVSHISTGPPVQSFTKQTDFASFKYSPSKANGTFHRSKSTVSAGTMKEVISAARFVVQSTNLSQQQTLWDTSPLMLNMVFCSLCSHRKLNFAASLLARWLPQQMDLHIWLRADFILFF